jgi:hypothetical protein
MPGVFALDGYVDITCDDQQLTTENSPVGVDEKMPPVLEAPGASIGSGATNHNPTCEPILADESDFLAIAAQDWFGSFVRTAPGNG